MENMIEKRKEKMFTIYSVVEFMDCGAPVDGSPEDLFETSAAAYAYCKKRNGDPGGRIFDVCVTDSAINPESEFDEQARGAFYKLPEEKQKIVRDLINHEEFFDELLVFVRKQEDVTIDEVRMLREKRWEEAQ